MLLGILIGLLIYLVILLVVTFAALRPVRSPLFLSPAVMGVPTEEITFESDGNTLRGWWCNHPNPKAVMVLLHGYVMNRSENAALAAQFYQHGFSSLLFDFRASGKSGGKQTTVGYLEKNDVQNACKFSKQKCEKLPIVLIGSSMGAAAAAFAASENPSTADAIVLDSCYSSLPVATLGWWRFIGGIPAMILLAPVILVAWPFTGFNPFKVNVAKALAQSNVPALIIHGKTDILARSFHAERNHEANPANRLVWFENSGHSEARWVEPERFNQIILDFLAENGIN